MLRHEYLRITGLSMVYTFAVALVLPVLAPYFSSRGFSDAAISGLFALFSVVMIVASLLVPRISIRFGRFYTMLVSLLLAIIAYWLYIFGSPLSIVVGRVLDAFCYASVSVLLFAKLEDKLESSSRGKYGGIALSFQYLSRLLAPLLGGILADRYLGLPFIGAILLFAVLGFCLRGARAHTALVQPPGPRQSIRWLLSKRELRPILLLGAVMNIAGGSVAVFLPLLIVKELGLSYVYAGAAISVYGAAHVLQFFFGYLTDRYGRIRPIILSCVVYAGLLILIGAHAHPYGALLVLLGVTGVGAAMWNVAAWSHMSDVASRENKETELVGVYVAIAKTGDVVGLLLSAAMVTSLGYRGMFLLLGSLALLGTLASTVWLVRSGVIAAERPLRA